MAAFDGIFRYDGKSVTNVTSNVSLARFFSVLEDRKGNLWFGSIVWVNKNNPDININLLSYQYFEGVDLLAIEGVSHSIVLTLMSEVGQGINKFESAKQFASWLRLAPNNKISGGKILSNRYPKEVTD